LVCQQSGRFSACYLDNSEKPKGMHIHDNLEIYYSLSGANRFIIGDTIYPVSCHDLFIINQFEAHRVEPTGGNESHLRYILSIMPDFLKEHSSPDTDLLACFYNKKEFATRISLAGNQQKKLMEFIDRLEKTRGFGADLMEKSILTEIILFIMKISKTMAVDLPVPNNQRISDILNYIDCSLDKDLRLENIAAQFYLSKGYLCRFFREHTGTTISDYICAKRISRAKQLLAAGHSVQETISLTGFNDYANFIRRFKGKVGTSPKKYALQHAAVS
jgi:AraC-like DNA-binding protein